jgi:dihydrofolate reductase
LKTLFHCHVAVSLDGRIARSDGSVDWLDMTGPPEEFGFAEFYAGVDAILMGRATYDIVLRMGEWPYAGKPTVVATNRPLPDPPDGVEARGGAMAAIVSEFEARGCRRVWVEGGGAVVRQMLQIDRLDVLEMAVLPIVLGTGIPLFPEGTAETRFTLRSCAPRSGGALHMIYDRRP